MGRCMQIASRPLFKLSTVRCERDHKMSPCKNAIADQSNVSPRVSSPVWARKSFFFLLIPEQLENLLSKTGCRLPPFCNEHLCPPIVCIIKDLHKLCSVRVTCLQSHSLCSVLTFSLSGRCVRRSLEGLG